MMTKTLDPNPQDIDRQLADFADEVMAKAKEDAPRPMEGDPELYGLEQTVLRLRQVTPDPQPDPAMATRIHNRAAHEFRLMAHQKAPAPAASKRRWNLRGRFSGLHLFGAPRTLALGAAALGLALVVVLTVFNPNGDVPLSGAAGGQETWLALVAAGLFAGVLFVFIWRNRR